MSTAAPMNASATTPTVLKTPHKPPVHKASNPNGTDSTNLKNFFQNLLNKNAPTTSATSAAAAASAAMSSTTPTASPDVQSKLEKSPSGSFSILYLFEYFNYQSLINFYHLSQYE